MGITAHFHDSFQSTWLPAFTDRVLLKLSRPANVMTKLLLRDTSIAAVIKSLVQYSKSFGPSYDASVEEARISNFRQDLVSYGIFAGCS